MKNEEYLGVQAALDLPALRTDFVHEILTNLAAVVDAVPNAQKKHLLRLLVEEAGGSPQSGRGRASFPHGRWARAADAARVR